MTYFGLCIMLMASSVTLLHANPCSEASNQGKYVCDPATNGHKFFYCFAVGRFEEFPCAATLVFDNALQTCTYTNANYNCPGSNTAPTESLQPTKKTTTTASPQTTTTTKNTPPTGVVRNSNPCQGKADGTYTCNSQTQGATYLLCMGGQPTAENNCPSGLIFDNNLQTCDWAYNNPYCPLAVSAGPTTTTTSGPTTTRGPTTTTTPGPTTTRGPTTTTTPGPTTTTTPGLTPSNGTFRPPTGTCNANNCQLPNCYCCKQREVPGGLNVLEVPQIVILTFDDDINTNNNHYYDQIYPNNIANALKNPNGCRTTGTFFVSGTWTDYTMVANLIKKGNEVSSHSRDHSYPQSWSYEQWVSQIEGQRQVIVQQTGVNANQSPGMRAPYLELGGESQFTMLKNYHFRYDSSVLGGPFNDGSADGPFYPCTLDYGLPESQALCDQARCPLNSYPGLWEVPILRQYTPTGQPCSMSDDCGPNGIPADATKEEVMNYFRLNFNRHYLRNRSPYMISLHATFFDRIRNSLSALKEFLAEINRNPDVWQISINQMLDWMQSPKPKSRLNEIASWQC